MSVRVKNSRTDGNTYMSSARTKVAKVRARVRTQRTVRMRELAREARDSERMGERRPPLPARRPSAAQPILCHLEHKNNMARLTQLLGAETNSTIKIKISIAQHKTIIVFTSHKK